jgi:hypothetical protein
MILLPHGVVAWDAYKEDENYAISWALNEFYGPRAYPRLR